MLRFLRAFFFLNTGTPGVRFRKSDKPTQATFKQLFDSVAFMKESSDTASTSQQGLVKIAQDTDAINRNSTVDADNFTKGVKPHHLPNVFKNPATPNTAISVTTANNATGRTGGTGKDFYVQNTMAVTSISPIIVVTQVAAGEDVELDFDSTTLDLNKVKVNINDPTASYLEDAVETDTPCRLEIAANGTDEKLTFSVRDKLYEMTMFGGTNVQFAAYFPANQGAVGSCWEGWVLANGGTYNNSAGTPITVVDMGGYFPVGYESPGNYPTLQANTDAVAASGADSVTLITAELPVHNHGVGTLATASGGAHTHTTSVEYDANTENGGSGSTMNGLECNQLSGTMCDMVSDSQGAHTHTLSGSTANTGSGNAHENRPPFRVVAYVVYIG